MNYIFRSVKLSIFDVHVVLRPLWLPESKAVKDPLRFLVNSDNYQNYYQQNLSTDSFSIEPLQKGSLKANKFWQQYMNIHWLNNRPDFWRLQIPFIAKPKINVLCNDIELKLSERNIEFTVEPEVFISGIGWTTNVNINLTGNINPSFLVELISYFRTGRSQLSVQDIYPFILQDDSVSTPVRLIDLYTFIAKQLRNDFYNREMNSPNDMRKIERYHVISIKKYEGEPLLYRREKHDKPHLKVMSPSEQALMHSLLYGRFIDQQEVLQQIKKKTTLYTQFDDANFALTEFQHGTLHFMQEILRKQNLSQKTLDCMGNNIVLFLRMIFILRHFYTSSKSEKNPKIVDLRQAIAHTLKNLPERYKNKFCQGFYDNNDVLP